jgi:CheY-like chemotaxis protein
VNGDAAWWPTESAGPAHERVVPLLDDDQAMRAVLRMALDAPSLADLQPVRALEASCVDEVFACLRSARPIWSCWTWRCRASTGSRSRVGSAGNEAFRPVPIIALSGPAAITARPRALAAGRDYFLPKPTDLSALLRLVRCALMDLARTGH